MKAKLQGSAYTVSVTRRDIARFSGQWPCSGLDGLKGVRFEYNTRGDLVDIEYTNGDSERWDGPALAALCDDAQRYAMVKLGVAG